MQWKLSHEVFSVKTAAEMMERDALSQSLNLARGHQKFDWLELGISAATAGFMGGGKAQNLDNAIRDKFGKAGSIISSELQVMANSAVTNAATGSHFDATKVLTDTLGGAIGSSLLASSDLMGLNELGEGAIKGCKGVINTTKQAKNIGNTSTLVVNEEIDKVLIEKIAGHSLKKSAMSQFANSQNTERRGYDAEIFEIGKISEIEGQLSLGGTYGIKKFVNDPKVSLQAMGLTYSQNTGIGKYDIDYDALVIKQKGLQYSKNKIKSFSFYNKTPGSPIHGDASKDFQVEAIDALISSSIANGLSVHDTAYVLAIANVESGYNRFAATGTSSASGIGQFLVGTGKKYHIGDSNRWDLSVQVNALVHHYKENKVIAIKNGWLDEAYIYKLHHHGQNSKKNEGEGLKISYERVMPKKQSIENIIKKNI